MRKKNILLRANLLICAVIVLGYAVTSAISYRANLNIFRTGVENVSDLTSEGIYYQIESIFTKPINVSLTMANDSLLKDFLAEEADRLEDAGYVPVLRNYLNAYREKYGYESVFLVSARTGRYYHFKGLDRVLRPGNPENDWYYNFLKSDREYSLEIDNDEAARNEITIFINCRLKDADGAVLGVVGVGFRVGHLQKLLQSYERQFGVRAALVGEDGTLEVSTRRTGYEKADFFAQCDFPELKGRILEEKTRPQAFWHSTGAGDDYIVARYLPNPGWHLIVENNMSGEIRELDLQFYRGVVVIVLILVCVLLIITGLIRVYNARIVKLTIDMEQKHRTVFQEAAEQLYENIYEVDVTHNRAASEATGQYFESLGAAPDVPYDEALRTIARTQIKEEFRQHYLNVFSPKNVLRAYGEGKKNLRCDFMISSDGGQSYYWMRITAHLFYWEDDGSVRMLVYRQNIDAEKRRERHLFEQMQKDSLTGLYNKAATQENIRAALAAHPEALFAFFILDLDKFKHINDSLGHAAGDAVLVEFARILREQFRDEDVVGRIGGDEFVAFMRVPRRETAERKARDLTWALCREVETDAGPCGISASIGVAVAPEAGREFESLYRHADAALYRAKEAGRNGFAFYESSGQQANPERS